MRLLLAAALVLGAVSTVQATQITGSSAAIANSTTGATVAYASGFTPSWTANVFTGSPSEWISFDSANLYGCSAAQTQTVNKNTTSSFCGGVTSGTVINFTDTFSLGALSGTYTLYVLADDSSSVTVNGTQIIAAGSGSSGPCSTTAGAINCVTVDTFNITSHLLANSTNVIRFGVTQNLSNSEFGLNFDLVSTTPEPATFSLAGIALLGMGALRLRRRRKMTAASPASS